MTRDLEPVYGDGVTDFDNDDVLAMFSRSTGRGAFLPASLRRLSQDTRDACMDVARTAMHVDQALDQLARDVAHARSAGASWGAIGWTLGMTGEGARKRFGTDPASTPSP